MTKSSYYVANPYFAGYNGAMNKTVRTPKQSRSIQKKEAITAAAMTLFSSKGYYSINSKDIAKEAGVSIGTFYAYFKDKKEVFLELLDHYKTAIRRNILTGMKNDTDLPHLIEALIRGIVSIIHSYPKGFYDQILVLSKTDEDIRRRYDEHLMLVQNAVKDKINGLELNITIDNDVLSEFIIRMNEALVMIVVNETNEEKKDSYIALYSQMLLSLIK